MQTAEGRFAYAARRYGLIFLFDVIAWAVGILAALALRWDFALERIHWGWAFALIGVTAVLLIFVIPVFEKMFRDFGGTLPAPTQFVIDLSNGLRANIIPVVVGITVFVLLVSITARFFLLRKKMSHD